MVHRNWLRHLVCFCYSIVQRETTDDIFGNCCRAVARLSHGKSCQRFLPDVGFTLWGVRHSLNPGPFNKKEHMLISIMASVGNTLPSSRYIGKLSGHSYTDQAIDVRSLYPMVRSVLRSGLCEVLRLPDLACIVCQFDGIRTCWPLSTILGVSFILHMACIPRQYCFEQLSTPWRV